MYYFMFSVFFINAILAYQVGVFYVSLLVLLRFIVAASLSRFMCRHELAPHLSFHLILEDVLLCCCNAGLYLHCLSRCCEPVVVYLF